MLMRLCKLSRLWFSAAGDTIRVCKHSFHLDIGSTGRIKDETAVLVSDLATIIYYGLLVHAAFPRRMSV